MLSSRTRSSGSFTSGQKVLADLRLPWDAGGLCRMDGLEMEVTMTEEEVLRPPLEPDLASSSFSAPLPSSCTRGAEQSEDVERFLFQSTPISSI